MQLKRHQKIKKGDCYDILYAKKWYCRYMNRPALAKFWKRYMNKTYRKQIKEELAESKELEVD